MLSVSFITFFGSLVSLAVMIGRKLLSMKRNGQEHVLHVARFELPYAHEVKAGAIRTIKLLGRILLVLVLRAYVRSFNFIKNKYHTLREGFHRKVTGKEVNGEKREVSKFLKLVSEYKEKVDELKEKIQEEEKSL